MRLIATASLGGIVSLLTTWSSSSLAQQSEPLPPLPQSAAPAQQPQPQYAQPQYAQPQPQYAQPQYGGPPTYHPNQPPPDRPPPVEYIEPPEPTHAPKFSLWTGGRLGFMGFGGSFYVANDAGESTGNFVTKGPFAQVDVGARLARRYVLYLFYERDFLGAGHRFEGLDATAYSDLKGLGFRYTAGDVDSAGFLTELSVGQRTVSMTSGGSTYSMSTLEFFKLGLGAEIRLSTLLVLSPMATISTGVMTDSSGDVVFSDGTHPPFSSFYKRGTIDDQKGYLTVSIGMGVHFDLLGK